jgi:mannose-6-phosphate isomerase
MEQWPESLLGKRAGHFQRFPLLLKFLDVRDTLSVQVHPSDQQTDYIPPGEQGKTEAWVVLEAVAESRIYAGLKPGTKASDLRLALANGSLPDRLACFTPKVGDGVFLPAGTVHALGGNIVVFEVQQNSDVTFRLYDWNHIDAKTGHPRSLQIDQALACIDYGKPAIRPVVPVLEVAKPVLREKIFDCDHFGLWRHQGESPFMVGAVGIPRVLVCIAGDGRLEHEGVSHAIHMGNVMLLPAVVGACCCQPHGAISLLEVSLPESSTP